MLGQERLLYCVREFFVSPGRRPCVPLPLFFYLDDGFENPCVDLIGKGGPNLLVPSGLFESIPSPRFVPLCDGFRFRFWCT